MKLLDYECQTTFWEDFSIAEHFGEEAIKDTYKKARAEWEHDPVYGTELSMVLNHKVGIGTIELTQGLVNFMPSYGKNIIIGCLRIEEVRI